MKRLLILLTFVALSTAKPAQKIRTWCFVFEGTSVCPLCPQRTGLLCPPANEDDDTTTIQAATTTEKVVPNETEVVTLTHDDVVTTETSIEVTTITPPAPTPPAPTTVDPIDEDFCYDNGGCDCPFICCKQKKGKPKKCATGFRLPPGLSY
ncbi:uncharacterized protein [Centruroides vittatus]|uniref:uncharacterized protein n=1 Tax=Centruroides vittatus TaxID=120091 RepID=UPI00350F919D